MVAVTRRRESVTRLLLAANASLEMRDRDGQTALALASQAGLVQTVRLLLERGALVNGLANKGRSPLFYAAGSGNIEVVAELLKAGADPNLPSWTCETPLLVALQQSQHKVLPLLLNTSGIRTDVRRKMDALTAAELVEILKEGKALPPTLSHKRFLALPPPSGPAPCVQAEPWLDCAVGCNGPPPELVDMNFITFRRLAHHHAEKDVRRFVDLWERVVGAQPLQEYYSLYGEHSILHRAAAEGNASLVRELLALGAACDVHEPGQGHTPLLLAIRNQYADVVKELLAGNASIDLPSYDGESPLLTASMVGDAGIAQILLNAGADVDTSLRPNMMPTPLILAAELGLADVVRVLLRANASLLPTLRGMTALEAALDPAVRRLLLQATGAKSDPRVRAQQQRKSRGKGGSALASDDAYDYDDADYAEGGLPSAMAVAVLLALLCTALGLARHCMQGTASPQRERKAGRRGKAASDAEGHEARGEARGKAARTEAKAVAAPTAEAKRAADAKRVAEAKRAAEKAVAKEEQKLRRRRGPEAAGEGSEARGAPAAEGAPRQREEGVRREAEAVQEALLESIAASRAEAAPAGPDAVASPRAVEAAAEAKAVAAAAAKPTAAA